MIYCKANTQEAAEVEKVVDLYCLWTGQRINLDKLGVHFSLNVSKSTKTEMCRILGMRECLHNGKYLGSPSCSFKNRTIEFSFIVDKLAIKLAGWKGKHMSMAGRNTLIKSVALAIPSFLMQSFLMSAGIYEKIDKLVLWCYLIII